MSDVLLATSRTICAPMFSSGSLRSISFATVTPSLVMVGDPNFLSRTTLRPLGPSVTLTASASASTPFLSFARASASNSSSFAAIGLSLLDLIELGEDVGGLDDHDLFSLKGDFRATVFPVEHLVPDLDVHRDPGALLEPPRAHGEHATLGGLLLRGIRDIQPAAHRFDLVVGSDHDPIFEGGDSEL